MEGNTSVEQVVQKVLEEMKRTSISIEDLETVTSLEGVNSLPAQKGEELVNVPLEIFREPALEAAARADAAANRANMTAEQNVFLDATQYENLKVKDDNKTYFIYEEE